MAVLEEKIKVLQEANKKLEKKLREALPTSWQSQGLYIEIKDYYCGVLFLQAHFLCSWFTGNDYSVVK